MATFRATGTLAAATDERRSSAAHVTWHAEKFRVFNRPDFNLVVSGNGELALTKGKVALTGSLKADEGRFVYQFDPNATLGDDVVVKGWARARRTDAALDADVPLVVDVNLDFGDRLTFVRPRPRHRPARRSPRAQRPGRVHRQRSVLHGERHVLRVRPEAQSSIRAVSSSTVRSTIRGSTSSRCAGTCTSRRASR